MKLDPLLNDNYIFEILESKSCRIYMFATQKKNLPMSLFESTEHVSGHDAMPRGDPMLWNKKKKEK